MAQENGLLFDLDIENSQKTGFFLDQKYNRRAVRELAKGHRVLDCFSHVGPFGLNAAAGGAEFVRCVDISDTAIALAPGECKAQPPGRQDGLHVRPMSWNTCPSL
jgi:23S rRNA (cytosine1962-C5)-methyltransferase